MNAYEHAVQQENARKHVIYKLCAKAFVAGVCAFVVFIMSNGHV